MDEPVFPSSAGRGPISIVVFGTPDYAVPSLHSLHSDARYSVELVVTQPDRPAGRSHRLTPSPVKIAAQELGLHVYQPISLRTAEARAPLAAVKPEVFVVAAYGLIFRRKTLAIPTKGCVNLHASLLPNYRGASPIAAAILEGDAETGVSLMLMDSGIDTGAIIDMARIEIGYKETTASLGERLGLLGAELLASRLADFVEGRIMPRPQPTEGASLTRMLGKVDGAINWHAPADIIERLVRAMWPWPRAWTGFNGLTLQVHASSAVECPAAGNPGQVVNPAGEPLVVCGNGCLSLEVVQPAGGKPMSGASWLAGLRRNLPRLVSGEAAKNQPPLILPL